MGIIKSQAIVAIIQVILNIPLSVFLAVTFGMKSTGIKLATMLLMIFSSIVYCIILLKAIQKKGF
jgi:Na+-driven multidrug efflux pump